MKKQIFFPRASEMAAHNTINLRTFGLDHADGFSFRRGKNWEKRQSIRQDDFVLNVLEGFHAAGTLGFTRQEDYIKVNFRLQGRHTTILHGYGQHDHDGPDVLITAGPWEMLKIDMAGHNAEVASVALCLKRGFFQRYMNLEPDQLPDPFRTLLQREAPSHVFHRCPLSSDMVGAARSILVAPFELRRDPIYIQAKAVEMMCLLINRMQSELKRSSTPATKGDRWHCRLHEARDLLTHHYSEMLTLERISRDVGLNRMALTSGFRELFGMSVYDFLQKVRMERAYELLQDEGCTVSQIAEAVGYRHACNFSTAFHAHFGCTPRTARRKKS